MIFSEKYPDAPGFLKFKCRFVMERLEGPQNASEAEKFLSYCLRVFPQDGYFMKYKGDLLWKKGPPERSNGRVSESQRMHQ